VETFHHLSVVDSFKDGTRVAVTPSDAAVMIIKLSGKFKTRNLTKEETLTALNDAQSRGVTGRMVHDWLHVRAAKLAGADMVITRDGGMIGLATREGLKPEWP